MSMGSAFIKRLAASSSWFQTIQHEPARVVLRLDANIYPEPLHMDPYALRQMVVFKDGTSAIQYSAHSISIDANRTQQFLKAMQASLQLKVLEEPPTFWNRLMGCNWSEQLESVNAALELSMTRHVSPHQSVNFDH